MAVGSRGMGTAPHEEARELLDKIRKEQGIADLAGWKAVLQKDVVAAGGRRLLAQHGHSLHRLLQAAYPELGDFEQYECRPRAPKGFWEEPPNQRKFMERVAARYGVKEAADWRRVTWQDIVDMGGYQLLMRFGSVTNTLQKVFPELSGDSIQAIRAKVSKGYWASARNRREFMDRVAKELGVESPSDWASVQHGDFKRRGGGALLAQFDSLHAALLATYPEHKEALEARHCREKMPNGYWQQDANVTAFIRRSEAALGVEKVEDWQRVSVQQVLDVGGAGALARMSLAEALQLTYTGHVWPTDAGPAKRSVQWSLLTSLNRIFHGSESLHSASEGRPGCILGDPGN